MSKPFLTEIFRTHSTVLCSSITIWQKMPITAEKQKKQMNLLFCFLLHVASVLMFTCLLRIIFHSTENVDCDTIEYFYVDISP